MTSVSRILPAMAMVAGLIGLGAAGAQAQNATPARELVRAGQWAALSAVSDRGVPMCIMGTTSGPLSFYVKHFRGEQQLVVHIFHDSWNMEPGSRAALQLQIDQESWSASATALASRRGLEITVRGDEIGRFATALRGGTTMTLGFPTARLGPWQIQLAGSDVASGAFGQCVSAMNGTGGGGTPADAKPGAGQPVQAPQPAPGQPVERPDRWG